VANPMSSVEVRQKLMDALRLDLVGPSDGLGDPAEILPQAPSRWYLTGYLVPLEAGRSQKVDEAATEELEETAERVGGADDDTPAERAAGRQRALPSSMGLSVLVPEEAHALQVVASWGDYRVRRDGPEEWPRRAYSESLVLDLSKGISKPREIPVPNSGGLVVVYAVRPVKTAAPEAGLPAGARTISVFLMNRRPPAPDDRKDEAFAFQVRIEVRCESGFLPRPDLQSLNSADWDERVADLQYRDVGEYAVGHNVSTQADVNQGTCHAVWTCWTPQGEVERVAPAEIPNVELSMDALSQIADGNEARAKLGGLVTGYNTWIDKQQVPAAPARRKETGDQLLERAKLAVGRIQAGINLLDDSTCLEAFRLANKVMAAAARQRLGVIQERPPESIQPAWRPFQLAFILMNLAGIAQPIHPDREVVDLLFFPTGGGKTEAYLGLAAFTLVLRRLQNKGIRSAGLSVLMRYTLRLLTLDQLSRASTLICALELERQEDAEKLGDWPFEIGLWVGRAATPNRMGKKGDPDENCAYRRTIAFKNDSSKPSPIPLEECPWCGTKFGPMSFRLLPKNDDPEELRVACINPKCKFSRELTLPILAVDEQIYRRLPCFLIATVDKFAGLPWTGQVGAFFGRVQRYDLKRGFYGPCDDAIGAPLPEGRLLPPDLVIQDELHLISGPLGTMAGLYEAALDELCAREIGGKAVRPKIIASTATVRRAEAQIRALFGRRLIDIFPPPGPNRRDSYFAKTLRSTESNARLYVGIAAQGKSPKAIMLRVYLALLGAAQKWYLDQKNSGAPNPADPYMTLVGYFNALRELGGARRLIEDEILNRLAGYGKRRRVGEADGLFVDRQIGYEPVELTSRIPTNLVAEAKQRLGLDFSQKKRVDVAIATNMISVGLDVQRLGLMVVFGQPKTSAEYIQATSRVGRDDQRPGLVVTILNVHKPRDRSHYERFAAYHETFYRSVEATSVTPFSPRALDKGLAATVVGLARQEHSPMTPPLGAMQILNERGKLEFVVSTLAERAYGSNGGLPQAELMALRDRVRQRVTSLLELWAKIAQEYQPTGTRLQYNPIEAGAAQPLLRDFLSSETKGLPWNDPRMQFRAGRSLRDVEPNVNLWMRKLDNTEVEGDAA
jgi:hypothetical protein